MPWNIGCTTQTNAACCLLFFKTLVYIFLKGNVLFKKNHLICIFVVSSHYPFPYVTDWEYKEQSSPHVSWNQRNTSTISAATSNPHLFTILLLPRHKGGEKNPDENRLFLEMILLKLSFVFTNANTVLSQVSKSHCILKIWTTGIIILLFCA